MSFLDSMSAPPPPPGQYPQPPPYQQPPPYYQQPPYQQALQPKPRSRVGLIVAVVAVAVVVVAVIALVASGLFSPKPTNTYTPPPPAKVTVVLSGTVWNLNAGTYEYVGPVDLTSNSTWTMSGAFTASTGIAAYAMSSGEYSTWGGSSTPPSAYYWTSGTGVTSGSVNTNLPGGTYYFVWDNTNFITATSVDITSTVLATASG